MLEVDGLGLWARVLPVPSDASRFEVRIVAPEVSEDARATLSVQNHGANAYLFGDVVLDTR